MVIKKLIIWLLCLTVSSVFAQQLPSRVADEHWTIEKLWMESASPRVSAEENTSRFNQLVDERWPEIIRLADQGNTEMKIVAATAYLNDWQTEPEAGIGLKWLQQAAEEGNSIGMYRYAMMLLEQGKEKEAFQWLKKGAEQGHEIFYAALGRMYYRGWGTKKDIEKAQEWLVRGFVNTGMLTPGNREFLLDYANILILQGSAHVAWGYKLSAALMGSEAAYQEFQADMQKIYSEYQNNPNPASPWELFMNGSASAGKQIDSRGVYVWMLLLPWSIAFEHGIGVPENKVAAQALLLYSFRVNEEQEAAGNAPDVPFTFWQPQGLTSEEEAEAESLAGKMWAVSQPAQEKPKKPTLSMFEPAQSAVLTLAQEYAAAHSKLVNIKSRPNEKHK